MRSDRPTSRGSSRGPSRGGKRVALLVDHGGLQGPLESEDAPDVAALADRLRAFAASLGRVISATAYADWTVLGEDAIVYRGRGIEPRLVLPAESGEDRSDVALALDALETALTVPGVAAFVVASVDASLHEVVVRLRRMGREVIVAGPRAEVSPELRRVADRFVAFEALLRGAESSAAEPSGSTLLPGELVAVDFDTYDWRRFLRLLDELEKRLSFVGLKYLNHKVLNRENCGFDDRARRQTLINYAIDTGILVTYQIDNIDAGGDPVTACRLNRDHEIVRAGIGAPPPAEPAAPAGDPPEAPESAD